MNKQTSPSRYLGTEDGILRWDDDGVPEVMQEEDRWPSPLWDITRGSFEVL